MNKGPKHNWGDYYFKKNKKDWRLELIHSINQNIPTFNEVFDEDSFYVFAFLVVIASILIVFFLARCVGVKVKEHHLVLEREWGGPTPASVFNFPWDNAKKQE